MGGVKEKERLAVAMMSFDFSMLYFFFWRCCVLLPELGVIV
jgi:hypothetical protein